MNFHSNLVGALDALILALAALVTVALLMSLVNPSFDAASRTARATAASSVAVEAAPSVRT
ncbi:MAG TPA: hypothetical protein VHK24_10755 [Steroidobacter sp.]|jgi:hypothetical protein|nr:hypothetical protein [Steroidobacter sp.]